MISFNESDKAQKNVSIFNGGVAGKADNVTIVAQKNGVDYTNDKGPDYKLVFTDEGGSIEMGFFYLNKDTHNPQYGSYEDSVRKQWVKLSSILTASGVSAPSEFADAKVMLDTMMSSLRTATKGKTFSVFANYGHASNPRKWLQIRAWVPFVEASGTTPTTLKASKIDQIERLVPDTETTINTGASSEESWTK